MDSLAMWGWVLFAVYFACMCYLAYRGERRTSGLKDYLVAPQSYGPVIIALALGATTCSAAATMGNPGLLFKNGWPALWYAFGYGGIVMAWALTAFKLSKVGSRVGAKSLPDFMGIRFQSDFMRGITAIATLLMVYYIAGQFAGCGWVFDKILHVPYNIGVVVAAVIITAYIVIGGTHADVLNCAIQGAIMIILAIIVTFTTLYYVGSISEINAVLTKQSPDLSWNVVFKNPFFGPFTGPGIMISLSLFALTPQLSKLWFSLKSERQIPVTLILGLVFMAFMGLLMWLGGLGSRAILPNSPPDTGTLDMLVKFMPTPIVAIAGVGILSAIMSTTAGLFLVVAIALVNDLYRDIIAPRLANGKSPEAYDRITLLGTRLMIPVVMVVGIIIALNPPKLLTALMWIGIGAFAGGISPVLLLGCTWRRTSREGAIAGSVLGLGTYLVCYFIIGKAMGVAFFAVPWAGCTVALIVGFVVTILVSLVTKPLPEEHLKRIFGS